MADDRTPILIGAGQLTQRDVAPTEAKHPVAMMAECAGRAAADAGLQARRLAEVDRLVVVNLLSCSYPNAPRFLAEEIGAQPAGELYTTIGGNTPQLQVNETAALIAAGEVRLALLAGAEAVYSVSRARKAGVELSWPSGPAGSPVVTGDDRQGMSHGEMTHGMLLPASVYPLFENALRVHYGLDLAGQQRQLGELYSRFSAVAAENRYAWFQQARTPAEITTASAQNRMIGFPYLKFMNAIIDVDQAAALLLTSVGTARELGVDPSRWVYLWGCADAHDLWFVSQRQNYHSSPAIRMVGRKALAMAGLGIDKLDYFDLYSCFPCAVEIGRDMLGITLGDPRSLTVTGGLAYHGGPGNNYTMHAIATMMDKLRAKPGATGLVTGLGWYLTKHSAGVYSAAPKARPFVREDPKSYQAALDREPYPELVDEPSGRGVIETYTVTHDRDGTPSRGIVIGRLDDGRRFLANTPDDRATLESLMAHEAIGARGTVSSQHAFNRFEPA